MGRYAKVRLSVCVCVCVCASACHVSVYGGGGGCWSVGVCVRRSTCVLVFFHEGLEDFDLGSKGIL